MNMIEKMARAMCGVAKIAPDVGWRAYAPHATACLTALSEPSEEMCLVGCIAIEDISLAMLDRANSADPSGMPDYDAGDSAKAAWQAMIAAASKG